MPQCHNATVEEARRCCKYVQKSRGKGTTTLMPFFQNDNAMMDVSFFLFFFHTNSDATFLGEATMALMFTFWKFLFSALFLKNQHHQMREKAQSDATEATFWKFFPCFICYHNNAMMPHIL